MCAMNCWEFKKCGREKGGSKVAELGECSASTMTNANGLNSGLNGGRACWAIAGTLCGGKIQGTFASKLPNCLKCEFYQLVGGEEGPNHVSSKEILAKLQA